jgi:geranylgeranyl reductase family protein
MASAFLSQKGIKHLLIDKAVFPRDKVCGDALSGKVFSVLGKLDNQIRNHLANDPDCFIPCEGIVFIAPNGKSIDIPFKPKGKTPDVGPSGFVSKRLDFDHYIHRFLDSDTCTFLQGHMLEDIERTKDFLKLTVRDESSEKLLITTDLLIACDGERSIAAKRLAGFKKELNHYSAGIRTYFKGVTGMHSENYIELHFLKDFLPGYLWIFPLPNGLCNVGAGILSSHASRNHINLRDRLMRAIRNHPDLSSRFTNAEMIGKVEGWGLPLGSKRRRLSGDNFLLTGDAASLIDPFTGEGISNAMYSGMAAAEIAVEAITNGNFSENQLKKYDDRIFNRLGNELKLSRTMQHLCNYPFLFNMIVNKASRNKELRETISCMFDDLDLRSKLKNPMFYFKLAFGDKVK